jgi:SAM-dependent methyltransferase
MILPKIAKKSLRKLFTAYQKTVLRKEFERQNFTRFNERPVELSFVFKQLARLYPRTILDVGTGTSSLPLLMRSCGSLVTAVDNIRDYWPEGMVNSYYHILDEDIANTKMQFSFELVTCISVLEHIADYKSALGNMLRMLETGGHLIATFPYTDKEYIPNVYKLPECSYDENLPYICQSFSRDTVIETILANDGEIIEQEYWQIWDGDFWSAGSRIVPPAQSGVNERHQLSCVLVKKISPRSVGMESVQRNS